MDVPVLAAATPVTIPAKVFDKIWVEEVVIAAPDPNGDVTARIKTRRFSTTDGIAVLEPSAGEWIEVKDVLATASSDTDLAAVVDALMRYIAKVGAQQGVIAAD